MKTPHVGNWYPNNLAIASLGIRMKICDQTRGERDKNFHPHTVIQGGRQTIVGSPDLLMTHAKVEQPTEHMRQGEFISANHMQALRYAIPCLNAERLNADFLPKHSERSMRIARFFAERFPALFERRVMISGQTVQDRMNASSLSRHGFFGITSLTNGWLMPNILNILMDGVIDAVIMGEREVFSLSGPDMFVYIAPLQPQLHQLYNGLREVMPELPEAMTYHVVRVAEMRFAVTKSRQQALQELIESYLALEFMRDSWAKKMREANADEKTVLIRAANEERYRANNQLREAIAACPEPFYDIKDGSFLSQYDLISSGEAIHIHPWALEAPLADVENAVRLMTRLRT